LIQYHYLFQKGGFLPHTLSSARSFITARAALLSRQIRYDAKGLSCRPFPYIITHTLSPVQALESLAFARYWNSSGKNN
jgi:hypothetical protein